MFTDFEMDERCSFPTGDRLDLYDGPNSQAGRLIRMFGNNVAPHIIESRGNEVLANFITGLGLRHRGFFAAWDFVD